MDKDSEIVCNACGRLLPYSSFNDRNLSTCKACIKVAYKNIVARDVSAFLKRALSSLRSARIAQGVEFDLTGEDLITIWERQEGKCALSGVHMTHHRDGSGMKKPFNVSIDRVNPIGPYVPQNVMLTAYTVNMMRGQLPTDVFIWWVRTINANT